MQAPRSGWSSGGGSRDQNLFFCQGTVAEHRTDVDFWWGDDLKIIEQVPAGVCQQCGKKYFEGHVYREMERLARGAGQTVVRRLAVDVLRFTPA